MKWAPAGSPRPGPKVEEGGFPPSRAFSNHPLHPLHPVAYPPLIRLPHPLLKDTRLPCLPHRPSPVPASALQSRMLHPPPQTPHPILCHLQCCPSCPHDDGWVELAQAMGAAALPALRVFCLEDLLLGCHLDEDIQRPLISTLSRCKDLEQLTVVYAAPGWEQAVTSRHTRLQLLELPQWMVHQGCLSDAVLGKLTALQELCLGGPVRSLPAYYF